MYLFKLSKTFLLYWKYSAWFHLCFESAPHYLAYLEHASKSSSTKFRKLERLNLKGEKLLEEICALEKKTRYFVSWDTRCKIRPTGTKWAVDQTCVECEAAKDVKPLQKIWEVKLISVVKHLYACFTKPINWRFHEPTVLWPERSLKRKSSIFQRFTCS